MRVSICFFRVVVKIFIVFFMVVVCVVFSFSYYGMGVFGFVGG